MKFISSILVICFLHESLTDHIGNYNSNYYNRQPYGPKQLHLSNPLYQNSLRQAPSSITNEIYNSNSISNSANSNINNQNIIENSPWSSMDGPNYYNIISNSNSISESSGSNISNQNIIRNGPPAMRDSTWNQRKLNGERRPNSILFNRYPSYQNMRPYRQYPKLKNSNFQQPSQLAQSNSVVNAIYNSNNIANSNNSSINNQNIIMNNGTGSNSNITNVVSNSNSISNSSNSQVNNQNIISNNAGGIRNGAIHGGQQGLRVYNRYPQNYGYNNNNNYYQKRPVYYVRKSAVVNRPLIKPVLRPLNQRVNA
ncbi:unnamed protein product [Brachionus calyciflorus]|uniref:Uncharacterized protein n=1 Tax=Brachionus calyciflorus TaxID=104777 RepID=A0A814G1H2_9BILA|nr:unnamed protein product [Brachionus calyciflorus]